MSEAVQLAKAAREQLAAALNALQSAPNIPDDLLDSLAEPIAAAMGVLHRIERTNGAELDGRDQALAGVRSALEKLQVASESYPTLEAVMEAVAASLGKAHALARFTPPTPAPAPAPQAASAPAVALHNMGPRGTMPLQQPSPFAAPAPAQPQYAPPAQQPFAAPAQQPYAAPAPQQPFAAPAQQAYAPPPQQAHAPPPQQQQPYAPPAQQPYAPPQQAYSPPAQQQPYVPPAQQQAYSPPAVMADPFAAPPPAAQPEPPRAGSQPAAYRAAPQVPTIDVEMGTHSTSNFYKGLGGNDVIEHGGIFVATYKVPKLGATVNLRVLLPGDYEFEAHAMVQWTREGAGADPGFGARFTQISPEGRQLVYRYTRNREPMFYDDL